jgi:hypothetical protein
VVLPACCFARLLGSASRTCERVIDIDMTDCASVADNAGASFSRDINHPLLPQNVHVADHVVFSVRWDYERFKAWMQSPGCGPLLAAVLIIGCSCGVVAFLYSSTLAMFIHLTWEVIPSHYVLPLWTQAAAHVSWWPNEWVLGLYVPLVSTLFGLVVGASLTRLGSPGDLPETIASFHENGLVPFCQVCSLCTCNANCMRACMAHVHDDVASLPELAFAFAPGDCREHRH